MLGQLCLRVSSRVPYSTKLMAVKIAHALDFTVILPPMFYINGQSLISHYLSRICEYTSKIILNIYFNCKKYFTKQLL